MLDRGKITGESLGMWRERGFMGGEEQSRRRGVGTAEKGKRLLRLEAGNTPSGSVPTMRSWTGELRPNYLIMAN